MTVGDLRTLKSFLEESSRGLGQGFSAIPWIWRTGNTPNTDEWQINALRTEWFRSRERYKRWWEQLVLLKREMTMAIRTFRKREEVWRWKAQAARSTPGMRGFALKQGRFYGELACRALGVFRPYLNDDIVTLKWSETWLRSCVEGTGFIDVVR
ncbi:hypothetical protein FRC08_012573 [Ceratobasidium sp. 394]|nr:hypothetical protein FRC08_012573 [Ceratobasidium sp. 394]